MTEISVIIVNFNAQHFLQVCIESLLDSKNVNGLEIIVVDNRSTDKSCAMLRQRFPEVRLIDLPANLGFSKANNIGLDIAQGEFILFLNPDTIVRENTLKEVCDHYKTLEMRGALGVRMIDGSGRFLPESKRNFPSRTIALKKMLGFSNQYYAIHVEACENATVDVLSGAFMFVKKDIIEPMGGFDEDFFMYGEDIDLSARLNQAGYRNYYLGTSEILHFKGESTPKDKKYVKHFYGAMAIFYQKYHKSNPFFNGLIYFMVDSAVFLKSIFMPCKEEATFNKGSFVYMGCREEVYKRLQKICNTPKAVMRSEIADIDFGYPNIFIDSNSFGYDACIDFLKENRNKQLAINVVSKDGRFCLRSEQPWSKGEVLVLHD